MRDQSTRTILREWQVGVRPVHEDDLLVGGEVDERDVDNKLENLGARNPGLPPGMDAASGEEVVPVHDDMDSKVEENWDPGDGSAAEQLGVT